MKKGILFLIIFGAVFPAQAHNRCRGLDGEIIPCGFHSHYPHTSPSYSLLEYRINFSNKKLQKKIEQTLSLALHGQAESQYRLGRYYRKGLGLKQSFTKAYAWMKTALVNGHTPAEYTLGELTKNLSPQTIAEGEKLSQELLIRIEHYKLERENMFDELHKKQGLK